MKPELKPQWNIMKARRMRMSKFLFKYNVESRGREGMDNTWIIKDLDTGEVILTNHIELKVPVSTNERSIDGGFGVICEGEIEIKDHPKIGKFVVIKGSK